MRCLNYWMSATPASWITVKRWKFHEKHIRPSLQLRTTASSPITSFSLLVGGNFRVTFGISSLGQDSCSCYLSASWRLRQSVHTRQTVDRKKRLIHQSSSSPRGRLSQPRQQRPLPSEVIKTHPGQGGQTAGPGLADLHTRKACLGAESGRNQGFSQQSPCRGLRQYWPSAHQ